MSRFNVPYQVGEGVDHIGFVVVDVKETYKDLVSRGAQPTDVDYYKNPKIKINPIELDYRLCEKSSQLSSTLIIFSELLAKPLTSTIINST